MNINESYLFSKDDLYINFDKFESEECNICLITGLSGSGKSTLGRELCKKYNAEYVELDKFFLLGSGIKGISKTFDPFFKKYSKLYKEIESAKYINDEQFPVTLMNNILNYCKSFKDKRFIIEGVQIFTYQNEELKKYPIIIKNTSALISMKRMILRDRKDISEPDENGKKHYTNYIKYLPKFLKYYIDDEREFKKFKKAIMNEGDRMNFETLNTNQEVTIHKGKKPNIIKECNTLKELNASYINYIMQPYEEQVKADEQCIIEYGITNRERYKELYEELSSRIYINNNLSESVSTEFEPDYVNTIHNTSFIDRLNDLPYFTPIDMSELGVYSKSNTNYYGEPSDNENNDLDWYKSYELLQYGVVPENFKELNNRRVNKLNELSKDFKHHKQTVLELGWNPEVPFTVENRIKATENTRYKLTKNLYKNEFYDATNLINELIVNEVSIPDKNPVYVILSYTATPAGKVIKRYTHGIYTHAALSLDSSLERLYSFNLENNFSKLGGFSIESIKGYLNYNKDSLICVYATFINDENKKKLKKQLDYFTNNVDKTRYSIFNIFTLLVNKPVELANDMICSQFVDRMLKMVDVDITGMASALVTPNDLYKSTSTKIYKVFEGRLDKYNKKKTDKIVSKLSLSNITEKESPIQFDNEGNLIIVKDIKDIKTEYNKSHKLLMNYDRSGNYEAMKPELCKLWYLNNKLEYMIFKTKKGNKEYYDMRARILNDFNKYLTIVNRNDPSYSFSNDYDKSKYSDNSFKISKHTLKHGIDYAKRLLKP